MPSRSFTRWTTSRAAELDQIEAAHRALGGSSQGRRYATQQVNHAYLVLLSSQFQGFCRDLHSECVDFLVAQTGGSQGIGMALASLAKRRKLDSGNPNPGNLGEDFGRFGIRLWAELRSADARTAGWQDRLQKLNEWRNAVAHQDFVPVGRSRVQLREVRSWRSACQGLTRVVDGVLGRHLAAMAGVQPW